MTGSELKRRCIRILAAGVLNTLVFFSAVSANHLYADVLRCVGHDGNTIYTDNQALCQKGEATSVAIDTGMRSSSVPSGKANYRTPARQYDSVGSNHRILIERDLVEGDPKLAAQAIEKLELTLQEVFSVLPENAAGELNKLTFYLMWGGESPAGGRKSGMSYFRMGEPNNYDYLDPRWENVIVIYSAKNLMYLDSVWSKKALMHELAHAWHLNNWDQSYELIVNAYRSAKEAGLYRNVEDYKGRMIQKAYAIKNHLEYFAELSAIYFVGGDYYPSTADILKDYDSKGEGLITSLWWGGR